MVSLKHDPFYANHAHIVEDGPSLGLNSDVPEPMSSPLTERDNTVAATADA
jgi:hypothetical protein